MRKFVFTLVAVALLGCGFLGVILVNAANEIGRVAGVMVKPTPAATLYDVNRAKKASRLYAVSDMRADGEPKAEYAFHR